MTRIVPGGRSPGGVTGALALKHRLSEPIPATHQRCQALSRARQQSQLFIEFRGVAADVGAAPSAPGRFPAALGRSVPGQSRSPGNGGGATGGGPRHHRDGHCGGNGVSGWADTDVDRLVARMRALRVDREDIRRLSDGARRAAHRRFGIDRFASDWDAALRRVAAGAAEQG